MRQILFVDDEPRILDGLRNMFRRYRHEWEVMFAGSGDEALAIMNDHPIDVIVTDMRMPKMDGAELLKVVQERQPRTVRIVLSGQTEHDSAMRTVRCAHQFLAKPCDGPTLHEVIERSCSLTSLLLDEGLRNMVGSMGELPVLPRVVAELSDTLAQPNSSLKDVAAVVERDPSLCAKVLQLVNSAFFGLPRRIVVIEQAVSYLGIDVLRGIAMMMGVLEGLETSCSGFSHEAIQDHSVLAARIAQKIGPDGVGGKEAFLAGMLHDVGTLILSARLPEKLAAARDEAKSSGRPAIECEREAIGVTHGEIGAYLLGLWGLPWPIVEAVAFHHEPSRVKAARFDLVGLIHVAESLADEVRPMPPDLRSIDALPLDGSYLEAVGVSGELAGWRSAARDFAEVLEVN